MKKFFSILALTLTVSFISISCRQEAEPIKEDVFLLKSVNLVKLDRVDELESNKGEFESSGEESASGTINCHTDYTADSGHACVTNAGGTYKVYWFTQRFSGGGATGGELAPITKFEAVKVSSCSC